MRETIDRTATPTAERTPTFRVDPAGTVTTDGPPTAALVPLSETDLTLTSGTDIRGREALDLDGETIGTIDELLVDTQSHEVRLVRLRGGGILGIGDRTWLIPVEAIHEVGEASVRLDRSGTDVGRGPVYQPELTLPPEEHVSSVYDYYGYQPFWVDRVGRTR